MPPQLSKAEVRRCDLPSRATFWEILIDKDIHHESIGQREGMKYLRESYYHRIECSAPNSLTTLMWK